MTEQFLTIADVSRALDGALTADGVRAASDRGELRVACRTPSGIRLFRATDVARFRQAREARHAKAK